MAAALAAWPAGGDPSVSPAALRCPPAVRPVSLFEVLLAAASLFLAGMAFDAVLGSPTIGRTEMVLAGGALVFLVRAALILRRLHRGQQPALKPAPPVPSGPTTPA